MRYLSANSNYSCSILAQCTLTMYNLVELLMYDHLNIIYKKFNLKKR